MFIHGVLLRSASRHRRRKMQGVDAGMQGVDDRMHAAFVLRSYAACMQSGMQAACIRSVTAALARRVHALAYRAYALLNHGGAAAHKYAR